MKRRNFLASLFALPFAAKPLEAEPWVPRSAKLTPEERRRSFERIIDEEIDRQIKAIHREPGLAFRDNSVWVRRNLRALRLNAPTGFRK